jgi:AraC family transcriptional regulator of adaptative response / DNA-3-methyladenine glycosylase II
MELDHQHCYEAIKARDARFDGAFFVGVSSTGIYCRPVCTVRTPGRDRCSFYRNAASAEAAGYRPCLRCRPELAPGASSVDAVRRTARLAAARIEAEALSDTSIETLAAEFKLSSRQLRRVIEREYGVSPIELAQTRRLLLAKQLLTDTQLRISDVAFASGFASVRRFNHLFRTRYRLNPMALRRQQTGTPAGGITLKLGYRPPYAWTTLVQFLASRGAGHVEQLDGARYLRTVRLGTHTGWIAAELDPSPTRNLLRVEVAPTLLPVLTMLQPRLRQLFDLDANPLVIEAHLRQDRRLAKQVGATPGLRVPGAIDGFELALRAVLGQQVTVKAATTLFGRFVQAFGDTVQTPYPGLDRLAPRAADVAQASQQQLIDLGLTRRRAETVRQLALAVADQGLRLEASVDNAAVLAALQAIAGIGPWTAQYIALRALADPDAFPVGDLGLLKALKLTRPAELQVAAEHWRPWRGYAALHLWNSLGKGG